MSTLEPIEDRLDSIDHRTRDPMSSPLLGHDRLEVSTIEEIWTVEPPSGFSFTISIELAPSLGGILLLLVWVDDRNPIQSFVEWTTGFRG